MKRDGRRRVTMQLVLEVRIRDKPVLHSILKKMQSRLEVMLGDEQFELEETTGDTIELVACELFNPDEVIQ